MMLPEIYQDLADRDMSLLLAPQCNEGYKQRDHINFIILTQTSRYPETNIALVS
jgi:hypothetical protein